MSWFFLCLYQKQDNKPIDCTAYNIKYGLLRDCYWSDTKARKQPIDRNMPEIAWASRHIKRTLYFKPKSADYSAMNSNL